MNLDELFLELKDDLLGHAVKNFFPGGWYRGLWARDAMHIVRGLMVLEERKKAKEIVEELSNYQLGEELAKGYKIKIGRGSRHLGYKAKEAGLEFILKNDGAIPTTVYPDKTIEIYAGNPDIDSTALWVMRACECALLTNDLDFARRDYDKICKALAWLESRDVDGDFLLEQGENEDWADCLRRRGKVASTQALWYEAVNKMSELEGFLNHEDRALRLKDLKEKIRKAINEKLWSDAEGYYADYNDEKTTGRLNQDSSLIIAFGIAPDDRAKIMLNRMEELLWNEYGALNVFPPYKETGPLKLKPGTYLNSAVWPWICGYEISARYAAGDKEKADELLKKVLPYYPYEWVSPEGKLCGAHPFATGMASILNVVSQRKNPGIPAHHA